MRYVIATHLPTRYHRTVLELQNVTLRLGPEDDAPLGLAEASARFPTRGHFAAVLGPSGCGKSTLLRIIAGLREPSIGHLYWEGRDLATHDLSAQEVGFVPQVSIAHEGLTVEESIWSALHLRVAGLTREEQTARVQGVLEEAGLVEIADRMVRVLSGGQRRRLALALELVTAPRLLLCDEVTSGLDPKAEDELVRFLQALSRKHDCLVISVTHSLRHLALYDSVLVLHEGHVAYHGDPANLAHYFDIEHAEELYPKLVSRPAEKWHRSWQKHWKAYYGEGSLDTPETPPPPPLEETDHAATPERTPGTGKQFWILLARRWRLFGRDRAQLGLHLALLLGFPCLVVIFALGGLPELKRLADAAPGNVLQQMQAEFAQRAETLRTGGLVSGLVMFQVLLLALMGANNGAREIAAERALFEKEKFAGLHPLAYVGSKAAFLGVLVLAQSIWMGVFVHWIVRFPGDLGGQIVLLFLVNAALTAICLGLSSLLRTAEQASLAAIYLVGFQLPLSGAVLALPAEISGFTRPFIAAYWGWSGYLGTLRDTRVYDAARQAVQTGLTPPSTCSWVLGCHVVAGLCLAWYGCRRPRWE